VDTDIANQPLSWIKRIPGDLFALDEKPLLGSPPPFPLENFASLLSTAFQVKDIQFHCEKWQWRTKEQLFEGYGDNLKIMALNLTPIEGTLWWVMSQLDFSRMMAHILSVDGIDAVDSDLSEALTTFFLVQLVDAFGKCEFDKKLSLQVLKDGPQPSTACLALDVETTFQGGTFPGRILLSPEFRHNMKQRYLQEEKKLMLESPLAESLEVVVHLEAGRVHMTPNEWDQLKEGDFVVLESCSLDPEEDKGRVMLVINGSPYCRAKLKQGNLKILEYPLNYEVS
jgi:flagellar motor switch protein FliN/FliY